MTAAHRERNRRLTQSATLATITISLGLLSASLTTTPASAATLDLVPAGATWQYLDTGVAPADSWTSGLYDDSPWKTGSAHLGYGDGDEATVVSYGPQAANKHVTTWFRRTFTTGPDTITALSLQLKRDDGAAVYLNGVEVLRSNLPSGPLSPTTLANFASDDGATWRTTAIPTSRLVSGRNTVAVEVHQNTRDSSDLSFDLALSATTAPATTTSPSPSPSASPTPTPAATSPSPTPAGDAARVYAAGDIGLCGQTGAATTSALLDSRPGPFLALGDLAYPDGTPADFANCYDPAYGRHKDRTWAVPGNHEYTSGGQGYFGYFGSRVSTPAQPWYSKDFGNWHVVMLNSNCAAVGGCGMNSPQYKWLQQDLTANPRQCLAAVWHHPRYVSGAATSYPATSAFWRLLQSRGADLVLSGHDHFYERFGRMNDNGQPDPTGIRQFVVGTGGGTLHPFGSLHPLSQWRQNNTRGLLQLDLGSAGYSWQFIPTKTGTAADTGSDSC